MNESKNRMSLKRYSRTILLLLLLLLLFLGAGYAGAETDVYTTDTRSTAFADKDDSPDGAIVTAVCERIQNMDFQVRSYALSDSLYDAEADKRYRDAFYKVVTNQTPVLRRIQCSPDYEEVYYKQIVRREHLNDQEFLEQNLENSNFYYMDYDGDGLPELIIRDLELYGLKYDPKENQVYLFLDIMSNYCFLMGAGQLYWHNPCLANKDIYSYESEDKNGNQVYVNFMTVADWEGDDWITSYYISVDEYQNVEVSRKLWEELMSLLQDARSKTPKPVSFDVLF